eukprot:gene19537-23404_t
MLPNGLTTLRFGSHFNRLIEPRALPEGITKIRFGKNFNRSLKTKLPDRLGDGFQNQKIETRALPDSLTSLKFGERFNRTLKPGVLPKCLKTLIFGNLYDQIIQTYVLPSGLTSIEFGNNFNRVFQPDVLPPSLTSLTFGDLYDQTLVPGVLPPGLKLLRFGKKFNRTLELGALPPGLGRLVFGCDYNRSLQPGVLPPGLNALKFGRSYDRSLEPGVLPTGLITLFFGKQYNRLIEPGILPNSLTTIMFGSGFNRSLDPGVFGEGLISIMFGKQFDRTIEVRVLPSSLKRLTFGKRFNRRLVPGVLPAGLTTLVLGDQFNQPIMPDSLPPGLSSLTLGSSFNRQLTTILTEKKLAKSYAHLFKKAQEENDDEDSIRLQFAYVPAQQNNLMLMMDTLLARQSSVALEELSFIIKELEPSNNDGEDEDDTPPVMVHRDAPTIKTFFEKLLFQPTFSQLSSLQLSNLISYDAQFLFANLGRLEHLVMLSIIERKMEAARVPAYFSSMASYLLSNNTITDLYIKLYNYPLVDEIFIQAIASHQSITRLHLFQPSAKLPITRVTQQLVNTLSISQIQATSLKSLLESISTSTSIKVLQIRIPLGYRGNTLANVVKQSNVFTQITNKNKSHLFNQYSLPKSNLLDSSKHIMFCYR